MKKRFTIFLSMVFVFCCAMVVTANAQMQSPEFMVTRFMPDVETELATSFDDLEKPIVTYEDTIIALPVDNNVLSISTKTEYNEEVLLKLTLPLHEEKISFINDNTVYYDNSDEGFIQTVQVYDKDFLISTATLGRTSPIVYVYNWELPEDFYMDYLYNDKTGQAIDDTIYIFDSNGKILYCIAVNDVRTVDGEKVGFDFSLKNNDIVLTLNDGKILDKAVTFSIQASGSYSFAHYFYKNDCFFENYDETATGKKEVRLSLSPNYTNLYSPYTRPDNVTHKKGSWATVYNEFNKDANWSNDQGMQEQYYCHYDNIPGSKDWHLEPWRPAVGTAATTAAFCNPK